MIDHVGIYGSRVAEGLSAFNVGLVCISDEPFAADLPPGSMKSLSPTSPQPTQVRGTGSIAHWGWVTHMYLWNKPSLVQIMFCRMFRAKPLSESMLIFCQILRNNCNEIWILQCSLKIWNLNLKMVSAKSAAWRSFCLCHSMANETMVAWNVILEKSSNMINCIMH